MANRTCSVDDCDREVHCRGWCRAHYIRWRRHGDPLGGGPPRGGDHLARFEARIDRSNLDGCWRWLGGESDGYGVFGLGRRGRRTYAHRFAYEAWVGPIPDGFLVDHACRNTFCVNPAHLRLADRSLNAQNVSGPPANNTSGERGVSWDTRRGKWVTYVGVNGGRTYGDVFDDFSRAVAHVRELRNRLHTYNDIDRRPA